MTSPTFPKYDRYKDSGVEWLGEIPAHWEVRRNLGIFDERKERGQPNSELLSVTVGRGIIRQAEITIKKDSSNDDKSGYKVVKVGDLAYNKMRAWQGALGISAYDGIVSPAYVVLTPRNPVLSKYFHYLYRTPQFITEANRLSYGLCDDMNSLRYEHFKTSCSPIPPDDEIDRIVAFLDEKTSQIDELIAKKQRQIELLDEQKAVLINRAVTRGLNPAAKLKPSGIEWIGDIPEHWEVKKLRNLSTRIGDGLHGTPTYDDSSTISFINGNNLQSGRIVITEATRTVSAKELRKQFGGFDSSTVLLSINGTLGNAALYRGEPIILGKSAAYINCTDQVDRRFLYYLLMSEPYRRHFHREATGTTIYNLSLFSLRSLPIPLPDAAEQRSVVKLCQQVTEHYRHICCAMNRQIGSMGAYKRTLIAHAVTGRIKVAA